MSAKSWPAENTGPLPASTTPSASEAPTCSNAASSARSIVSDRALRRCGRFIVMVAKAPSRRMTTSGSLMGTIVLEPALAIARSFHTHPARIGNRGEVWSGRSDSFDHIRPGHAGLLGAAEEREGAHLQVRAV